MARRRARPISPLQIMGASTVIIIVLVLLIVLAIVFLKLSLKIVNHAEVMIVERFGAYSKTLMPGLHFITPIIEQVRRVHWRYARNTFFY